MQKLTQEDMVQIYGKIDLILDEKYINMHTKIHCHDNDGYKYFSTPMDVRNEKMPMKFHMNNPHTIHNIKTFIINNRINAELLDTKYFNNSKTMNWKCECGEIFVVCWNKFLGGQTHCNKCAMEISRCKVRKSFYEVSKLFFDRNYTLLSTEYTGVDNSFEYICNKHKEHGSQFINLKNFIYSGKGCKYCAREIIGLKKRKKESEIKILTESKNFIYSGVEYIKNSARILYICPNHTSEGIQYKSLSDMRKAMIGICPNCSGYRGEEEIKNVLTRYNINFTSQKRFSDCRNILPLSFDLYLEDHNILIEYDGIQHYVPTRRKGMTEEKAKNEYEQMIIRDGIKNEYCKNNNIPLIRIPYWELENIECYLIDKLSSYIVIPKVA